MAARGGPELAQLFLAEPEEAHQVGVRAEAAVPDADGELGAQPRRDQRVWHVVHDERRDRQRVGLRGRAEQADARDGGDAVAQLVREARVVRGDRRPADALELARGGGEGERAEHVGRSGFLSIGRGVPDDLVEVDQVDGAAADQERVAVLERRPWADQRAGAERRVHLVPAEGDEVGRRGERPVRRELGAVDEDLDSTCVRCRDDLLGSAAPSR